MPLQDCVRFAANMFRQIKPVVVITSRGSVYLKTIIGGAKYGELTGIDSGGYLHVRLFGRKRSSWYHPSFWKYDPDQTRENSKPTSAEKEAR